MHKTTAVSLQNISKVYRLYDKPIDRLKESLHPLKKRYHKEFYALKDINLDIKKGEVLGIVGVNGAGKSTLLKIITGVLTPTTGRVNIHGQLNAILELGSSLKPEMTGLENIKLNLQINGIEADRDKLTQEIIEFADIGEHINQPIKSYSSGMKARLGFAIATSTDPDVLIVDEVLAVGDVLFQRKCYSKIEKLFKDGKTVVFVSHSAQSVIEFCTRAVLLYDRRIIMDDTPKKVTDYYQKLVFSRDKQGVLDEIRETSGMQNTTYKKLERINARVDKFSYSKKDYIRELKVKQRVVSNGGFTLDSVYILDENNNIVNVLEHRRQYKIKLTYTGNRFVDCSYGVSIRNLKGTLLSGSIYKGKDIFEKKSSLEFTFICSLLHGTYLLNLNIICKRDELRIWDALIFEVRETKKTSDILKNVGSFEIFTGVKNND